MFTNIHDDACTVFDRDARNEKIYDWNMDQDRNFRRGNEVHQLIYRNNSRGLEQDINTENNLLGLNYALNTCNTYEAGIQKERLEGVPYQEPSCLVNDLKPQYTKMSRIANHSYTYENPYKPQPGYYYFITPPTGVQHPGVGLYSFDRKPVDTRQNAKDKIVADNKKFKKCGGYY